MRKGTIVVILLLSAMLIASTASGAFSSSLSMPKLSLSKMSTPSFSGPQTSSPQTSGLQTSSPQGLSSIGSLGVKAPQQSFGFGDSPLSNMEFFSPHKATTQKDLGSVSPDMSSIWKMLSQLPATQTTQTATATPTPLPFNSVSNVIPDGSVIFIEIGKTIMPPDPTSTSFKVPNVTMNYKYDASAKKIYLKRKSGVDYSAPKIIVGYTEDNQLTSTYLFDYKLGGSPYSDIPIIFTGADGRISVRVNGTQKDLKPGEQTNDIVKTAAGQTTITVGNNGLIPLSNVVVQDTF